MSKPAKGRSNVPIELLTGDCSSIELEPDSYDALLSDPPYGLEFIGKEWDKAVPPAATWKHLAKALKPGAHLLLFGGPRTYHRLAVALEDAGLEIRDCLCWLYASGMPKGHDLLKPAWEPIILARKPIPKKLRGKTPLLNIDGSRIGRPANDVSGWSRSGSKASENRALGGPNGAREAKPDSPGRWPANVLLDGEAANQLDLQSGQSKSKPYRENVAHGNVLPFKKRTAGGYSDSGGASRFFWVAKASQSDRGEENDHPTVKPTKLAEYLARLLLPADAANARLLVPFCGSGSEVIGAKNAGWANVTGIELEPSYLDIAKKRLGL